MWGVLTDVSGRSDVVGLYCLGEMAYTGLHGANRLASNSLLECLVMGQNAAKSLQEPLAKWSNREVLPNWSVQTHQKDINLASSIPLDVAQIKQLMQQHLGVIRRQEDVAKLSSFWRELWLICPPKISLPKAKFKSLISPCALIWSQKQA